jgi:hypothetical protein
MCPRLIAIYRHKEHSYEESPEEKIRRMMEKKLLKLGIDSNTMSQIREQSKQMKRSARTALSRTRSGSKCVTCWI